MFIEKEFAPEVVGVCQLFKRQSTLFSRRFTRMQRDLPIDIGQISDIDLFKSAMPDVKHHEFFPYSEVFRPDGSPQKKTLAPISEFCRIVLELERQAGFDCTKAQYDLNGRTEDRKSFHSPSLIPHYDGGDPLCRVYLLSDEVAPTRFGFMNTEPYHIYFYSGTTRHQATFERSIYQNLPTIPRNIAHLRICGGSGARFPIFG